ncbi:N/A [soil metagenome]
MHFRRLTDDDLPMLHRWMNDPGVVQWWEGEDVSWEGISKDYGSGSDPAVEHWIAVEDGTDIGWIQCYATADSADDEEVRAWFALGVPDTAAGIDYVVGEPAQRGTGVGTRMVGAFVEAVVFGQHPSWTAICASPYEANEASWRVLEKSGFTHVGTFDDDEGPCRLMRRDRP